MVGANNFFSDDSCFCFAGFPRFLGKHFVGSGSDEKADFSAKLAPNLRFRARGWNRNCYTKMFVPLAHAVVSYFDARGPGHQQTCDPRIFSLFFPLNFQVILHVKTFFVHTYKILSSKRLCTSFFSALKFKNLN